MAVIKWETEAQVEARENEEKLAIQYTFKTDIWMRCTDDEAELLDGALQVANVRQRRMWDDCIRIEHASELFTLLQEQMTATFGAQRAAQILKHSNEV